MYICVSKLDELPKMSPALPCNIQRSLQPVNQPEVEVTNESAGRPLPFSHGKILSCFKLFFPPFNLAISVPRDSFTLKSLSFSIIHSVVFSLLILQMFSVLFVYRSSRIFACLAFRGSWNPSIKDRQSERVSRKTNGEAAAGAHVTETARVWDQEVDPLPGKKCK